MHNEEAPAYSLGLLLTLCVLATIKIILKMTKNQYQQNVLLFMFYYLYSYYLYNNILTYYTNYTVETHLVTFHATLY